MRGKLIIALGIFLAFAGIFCQQVSAAFVDGIERFDGAIKDTETWEEYSGPFMGEVYQNDRLILNYISGEGIDYTTRNITVGVGDIVRVELLEHPSPYAFSTLLLTTNSEGTNRSTTRDDHFLLLAYSYFNIVGPGIEPGYYFGAGSGSSGTFTIQFFGKDTPPPSPGNPLILQIERTSSNSAIFSAFTSDMTLIDSKTISSFRFPGVPDNLFISLDSYAPQGGHTVFDNVTIIPEPATIFLLGFGGLFFKRKRS